MGFAEKKMVLVFGLEGRVADRSGILSRKGNMKESYKRTKVDGNRAFGCECGYPGHDIDERISSYVR